MSPTRPLILLPPSGKRQVTVMDFIYAQKLEEALDALRSQAGRAKVLAGGTDLMIQIARGEKQPQALIFIGQLKDDLATISLSQDGYLNIGALVTHRQICADRHIQANYPALAMASASVGGWQTQSVGTLAGNICNASPAADTVPPLLVHEAVVTVQSAARGLRDVPLEYFITGRRQIAIENDEMVVGITLAPLPADTADAYLKVGRRKAMEVAIAGLAMRLTMAGPETVGELRVATCATGPVPRRAREVEALFSGQKLTDELVKQGASLLGRMIQPIDDTRASAQYRKLVIPKLFRGAVLECLAKLGIAISGLEKS